MCTLTRRFGQRTEYTFCGNFVEALRCSANAVLSGEQGQLVREQAQLGSALRSGSYWHDWHTPGRKRGNLLIIARRRSNAAAGRV
jgi:hypothetical protein